MPKKARELSPMEVKRLKHPGHKGNATFPVGGVDGLLLQISETGARSWVLRASVGGVRRHIGLGAFPMVSLGQARDHARELRDQIRRGVDPVEERRAAHAALAAARARSLTFEKAVERFLEDKGDQFAAKRRQYFENAMATYVLPDLGQMAVAEIGVRDVQRVLAPIWTNKAATAVKVRGFIEAVFSWATVAGHREGDNPARLKGGLDALLPKRPKRGAEAHHPAVALADAPRWYADLLTRSGMATAALRFAAMTAARSGEVRGATWQEIDLKTGVWTIPATRMKSGREHRVPLSREAVALLRDLPRQKGQAFVFPSPRGKQLSDAALGACMTRIHEAAVDAAGGDEAAGYLDPRSKRPAVPHGLRSSFRDWAAERGVDRDVAELALAHSVGDAVERAYRRTDMFDRRRALMESWAAFLRGEERGNVVPLMGAAL